MAFGIFRRRGHNAAPKPASAALTLPDAPVSTLQQATVPVAQRPIEPPPFLWQDVAYGMTVSEVLATRLDAIASGNPQRLNDGAVSDVWIPSLSLADRDYSVLFYFKDSFLSQVTIATNGGPTAADFHAVTNALRLRYGREVSFKENASSFSTGEWLSADGINIVVVFHDAIECLNINFQYRYANAATQL